MVLISSGDAYLAYACFRRLEPKEMVLQPRHETRNLERRDVLTEHKLFLKTTYALSTIPVEQATLPRSELPGTVLRLPKVYGPEQNCDLAPVYKYRAHP